MCQLPCAQKPVQLHFHLIPPYSTYLFELAEHQGEDLKHCRRLHHYPGGSIGECQRGPKSKSMRTPLNTTLHVPT